MMMRLILTGCLLTSLIVAVGGAVNGQKSMLLNRLLAHHSSDVTRGRGRPPHRMTPDVCTTLSSPCSFINNTCQKATTCTGVSL